MKIKTSLTLEESKLQNVKKLARQNRRSVSQLIEMALDEILPPLEAQSTQGGAK